MILSTSSCVVCSAATTIDRGRGLGERATVIGGGVVGGDDVGEGPFLAVPGHIPVEAAETCVRVRIGTSVFLFACVCSFLSERAAFYQPSTDTAQKFLKEK